MHSVQLNEWDIICITESHLLQHIPDSFVDLPGYTLYRHDTSGSVAKHGVCCFVRTRLMIDKFATPAPNVLTFHLVLYDVYVCVIYRPPSNTPQTNEALANFLVEFCQEKEVIVMGDLNLPNIEWTKDDITAHASPMERMFVEAFISLGLTQWVAQPTFPRSGNILDLILTSDIERTGNVEVLAPLPGCDHCPTSIEYIFSGLSPLREAPHPQRSWKRGNFHMIRRRLAEVDWGLELAYLNADLSYEVLTKCVTELVNEFVPLKQENVKAKLPWATRPPKSLIQSRKNAWNTYKAVRHRLGRRSTEATTSFSNFCTVNRQFRNFAVKSQAEYEAKLINDVKEKPKLLHSLIRRKKVGRPSVGPLKQCSGQLTDDPKEMADIFVDSFASVFITTSLASPVSHQMFDGSLSEVSFSVDDVYNLLTQLDGNSSCGPDGIHPLLLKECAGQLAYPLHVIFSRSLREGILPAPWKFSLVTPIFKKGHRYDPLNYRPISVTSVPGKVMEHIIRKNIYDYLETNLQLSPHQFGFRPGRSTQEQLLLTYDFVSKQLDDGGVTDLILFDFSKAFDVVVHSILIDKLRCLGIQGTILRWVKAFLSNRYMSVCVNRQASHHRSVTSGVPQGSVLGPTLFLVYINSVASELTCNYKVFADDLKIYACFNHSQKSGTSSVAQNIQSDVDILVETALSWGLQINVKKCAVLRFSRHVDQTLPAYTLNGCALPNKDFAVDLGVTIDTTLKFHVHVKTLAHKASVLTHCFLKSTVCRSREFMIFLLITHIRPMLEYCSCLWDTGYIGDIRLLENVQRRWTKQIDGLKSCSYSERLQILQLYSVQGRLLRADLILYWKILHEKSCISPSEVFQLSSSIRTRGHQLKLFHHHVNTDVRKRFFTVRRIHVWNSLPECVVCAPDLNTFKHMLDKHIPELLYAYAE